MLNFPEICIERPVGSNGNNKILNLLNNAFSALDFKVSELPFDCTVWQSNNSFVEQNNKKVQIFPSPFSRELKGNFPIKLVSSLMKLENNELSIEIVSLNGEDSPEASGQLAYLKYLEENNLKIKSVVNIDGVGHIGSENIFSLKAGRTIKGIDRIKELLYIIDYGK